MSRLIRPTQLCLYPLTTGICHFLPLLVRGHHSFNFCFCIELPPPPPPPLTPKIKAIQEKPLLRPDITTPGRSIPDWPEKGNWKQSQEGHGKFAHGFCDNPPTSRQSTHTPIGNFSDARFLLCPWGEVPLSTARIVAGWVWWPRSHRICHGWGIV